MLQSERNLTTDENQWSYGYHVSLSIERGTSHPSGFVDPDSIVVVSGMVTKGFNNGTVEVSTSREHDWRVEGFPHMYFNSTPSEDAYDPAVATEQTNNTDHMYIGADYSDPPDGPLNAFNGNVTKLGLAFDAAGNGAIFYIGQDAGLYQMQERKQDEWWKNQWFKTDRQDTSRWPFADSASSDIAVAFDADSDKIWIYYVVGGTMTQVHQSSSGVWEEAVALPKSDAPVEDPAAGEGDADGGLSGGAKAGIGVGVGVGGLVAALAAAYAFFRRRRSRRNQNDEPAVAAQEVQAMATGPVMPASPQELYVNPEVGQWQYHDLRLSQKYSSVGASPPLQVYHEMLAPGSTQWIAPNNDQVAEVPASMSPK
ncbi:hypothetical protein SLS62_003607 [Diatrype stigma]|uniref:Uncharacterized protein n=1 Tax=Diatrype stigma TaxID=117547 RepID=A0AAN9URZ5_9PEZI